MIYFMDETMMTWADQDTADAFAGWTDEAISEYVRYGMPPGAPEVLHHPTQDDLHPGNGEPLGQRREFLICDDELFEVVCIETHQDERGYVARQTVTDGQLVWTVDSQDLHPGTL